MNTKLSSSLCMALLCAAGSMGYAQAQTNALQTNEQVPGVYKMQLGNAKVTALFDGVVYLKPAELKQIGQKLINQSVSERYVPATENGLQTAVNAFLIDTGDKQVLVDTGTTECFPGDLGHVLPNLNYAGYNPNDIDDVVLTHGHPDHICGLLTKSGAMAYPNAKVWINNQELQYWLSDANKQHIPKQYGFLFDLARKALKPYQDRQQVVAFTADSTLPVGLKAIATPGHTVGHSSFLFNGGSAKNSLLIWGDLVHYHTVQLKHPEATYEVDNDYAKSVQSRKMALQMAAQNHWWVAGAHMPFPGIGHISKDSSGYDWVPAEFSPLPVASH